MNAGGSGLRFLTAGKQPAWGPDGKTIVYGDGSHLFTIRTNGTTRQRLPVSGASQPTWSIRDQIAYVQERNLYVLTAAGGKSTRLTARGVSNPDFSPDGRKLLFTRRVRGSSQLFTIDLHSRHLHQLTHQPGQSEYGVYSPDGRRIAFSHSSSRFNYSYMDRVWVMRADGTGARKLFRGPAEVSTVQYFSASWQPIPVLAATAVLRARAG